MIIGFGFCDIRKNISVSVISLAWKHILRTSLFWISQKTPPKNCLLSPCFLIVFHKGVTPMLGEQAVGKLRLWVEAAHIMGLWYMNWDI